MCRIKRHLWVLPVVWMGIIFILSHQPGSDSAELSSGITSSIIRCLKNLGVESGLSGLHSTIRVMGHFFVFFVLGCLWYMALHFYGISSGKGIIIALSLCVGYAIFDELHQLFVPGRACELSDILVDSLGSFLGIFLTRLVEFFLRRRIVNI